MKSIISRIFFFCAVVMCLVTVMSCDKHDDNGPFYGNWLLTDVIGPDGPMSAAPETGFSEVNTDKIEINVDKIVSWAVRNDLIMMRNYEGVDFYFFTFTRDAKAIQFHGAFYNDGSNDKKIEFSEVPAKYRVPADGHFDVVSMDRKGMVLRTGDITLKFKKN